MKSRNGPIAAPSNQAQARAASDPSAGACAVVATASGSGDSQTAAMPTTMNPAIRQKAKPQPPNSAA